MKCPDIHPTECHARQTKIQILSAYPWLQQLGDFVFHVLDLQFDMDRPSSKQFQFVSCALDIINILAQIDT